MTPKQQLYGVVCRRAELDPDRMALQWLENGVAVQRVTYAELCRKAELLAQGLRTCTSFGDRVLLALDTSVDFIAAFLACQCAGRIAVPIVVPPGRDSEARTRALHIWQHCEAARMVVSQRALASFIDNSVLSGSAASDLCLTLTELEQRGAARKHAGYTPHDIALLQYTSGSTAKPKGVVVGQSNLIDNLQHIRERFAHDETSVGLIWLPPQHDMGLIGGILQPLFVGFPCSLMAPLEFVQRPLRWLEVISRLRATTSGGPCFAYDLCVRRVKPEDVEGLDLQSWRVAFVGAEKVRSDVMTRFASKFASAGFRSTAILPCYGLAEATLMVSGGTSANGMRVVELSHAALAQGQAQRTVTSGDPGTFPTKDGAGGIISVSCGRIVAGHDAIVVDPDSRLPLSEGGVGELWLNGPSVAQGYFRDPAATAETFEARLAGDDSGDRYLRTGDQAFLLNGELHICGRYKSIIVIRGKKYTSEDVEALLQRDQTALVSHGGVAFSCEITGEEQLVVVHELERSSLRHNLDEIRSNMQRTIGWHLGLKAAEIALVLPASLPRTTSGKIQRGACLQLYRDGKLRRVETALVQERAVQASVGACE